MLHRGKYRLGNEGADPLMEKTGFKNKFMKVCVGIDSQYTKGDKILAWSVFIYSVVFTFGILFLSVVLWNLFIFRWPAQWWSVYYFILYFIVSVIVGTISTVWFFIGTTIDLKKMFSALASRQRNEKDDGRVIGHVNADEIEIIEEIDQKKTSDQ